MPGSTATKKQAVDALVAAKAVHMAAWEKLGDMIALKQRLGRKYKRELRRKTATARRISVLNSRILDAGAATKIIRAPSVAEIRSIARLVRQVQVIAIKEATLQAALSKVVAALRKSSASAAKVRLG